MSKHAVVAMVLSLAVTAPAARAAERVRLFVNGSYAVSALDFSESRTFKEFAEDGKLDSSYTVDKGFGGEFGVQYNFSRHLGVAAGFFLTSRDASAEYNVSLPHPLYLNQPRIKSGTVDSLSFKESGGQLDLVVKGGSASFEYGIFGGVTLMKVEADLIQQIRYSHSYPYDSVTVTGVTTLAASDSPIGFNGGGYLDYRLGERFGLGAQASFSRARAKLVPAEGSSIDVDAGGFKVSAGVRLYF